MPIYHVEPAHGTVEECRNSGFNCPVSSESEHFTSQFAAEEFSNSSKGNTKLPVSMELNDLHHGDRISLENPHTGFVIDGVLNSTYYDLLIQTSGANAPTNDVLSLIRDHGWILRKRVPAHGEFAMDAIDEHRLASDISMLDKDIVVYREQLSKLEKTYSWNASNLDSLKRFLEAKRKLEDATAEREEKKALMDKFTLATIEGDRKPGFTGLQKVPYDFSGTSDYRGRPRYEHISSDAFLIETPDGYSYFKDQSAEPLELESFSDAVEQLRRNA